MKLYAVIVAGGTGARMMSEIPKQFIEIAAKPILIHTIERFKLFDNSIDIITVLPKISQYWNELQSKHSFSIPHIIAVVVNTLPFGQNGLELITEPGLVTFMME